MNTPVKPGYARALDLKHGRVDLSHGAGGRAMAQLISGLFAEAFANPYLAQGNDGAVLPRPDGRLVLTTDSHVVSPLFFPGGDIGCLAVHGTINDVAMMGAKPLYLTASFILEEGFPLSDLKRIVHSMAAAAREAEVAIVSGDTKVVERGNGDGVFISTTGIGELREGVNLGGNLAQAGDAILLSGSIAEHGMAIMSHREGLEFSAPIVSDTAALHTLVATMLDSSNGLDRGAGLRVLRDPTRGGLAATLNEIAQQSGVGMLLRENAIAVKPAVEAACEFLGLDPLYVANEGKLIAVCALQGAERLLNAMRAHPLGREAAIIGTITRDAHAFVQMETRLGGRRVVDWLAGEQLPRIC